MKEQAAQRRCLGGVGVFQEGEIEKPSDRRRLLNVGKAHHRYQGMHQRARTRLLVERAVRSWACIDDTPSSCGRSTELASVQRRLRRAVDESMDEFGEMMVQERWRLKMRKHLGQP